MLGAIIGDIVGSRFEWANIKSKEFELFTDRCVPTDDSIMTLAIAKAILGANKKKTNLGMKAIEYMQELGRKYPDAGYGGNFSGWLISDNPHPYNSFGNGSAMRVSPCAYAANSLEEAIALSDAVTETTHNHPEGMKGAEATTVAIYMALHGSSLLEIEEHIKQNYYNIGFTLDEIRDTYTFDVSCMGTMPVAMEAFFESKNFEDAIRNAISIGGDSDTIAAITGAVAEAYYGIPVDLRKKALEYLDDFQVRILNDFENKYGIISDKQTNNGTSKPVAYVSQEKKKTKKGKGKEKAMENAEKAALEGTVEWEHTNSQDLFNKLYKGCDILRGPITRDDFKTYLIPFLFFKRISDVYDEEEQSAIEEYGDDVGLFEDIIHKFEIPDGCHWDDIRNVSENVGEAIVHAMNGIERANPDTLAGLFSSFDDASWTDKKKLSDERLKNLIEHFSTIKVGNKNYSADVMGNAYEYLLKKFADLSKKNAGEIYTPRSIVSLCVMLLDPQPGDTVYDPACGTGGMLIESIKRINDMKFTFGKIYGQEKNLSTSAIARMNMFLHGASDFNIAQGDTLRDPAFTEGDKLKTFNKVIANPPFGLSKWGSAQFASDKYGRNIWGTPSDNNADWAWIQHMVASMDKDNGKCAVIMPQGVLFHGNLDGKMREKLIETDKIEAVITLAGGIFYGAGVSACILLLNNNKLEERKNKIMMVDASKIFTHLRAQNVMTDEEVDRTYKYFKDYKDVIDFAKVVTLDEIKAHDYILSVATYIEKTPVKVASPEEVRTAYKAAYEAVVEAEEKMKKLLIEGGYVNE